jgi:glycosyltransferase involved in cell wall biosynthesis
VNKLVSIGLPIIKFKFLKESIDSCLGQSYNNFELIVLNNAKEKETKIKVREIINSFDDIRIKYYENEEQIPMIQNWNKCLSLSNGDYFSILCDDDIWHENFLLELIYLSNKYPEVNVFHCKVAVIDSNNNIKRISEEAPEHQSLLNFIYSRISGFNTFFLSDFLLKTKALKELGGFIELPSGWGSDDITYYFLAKKTGVAFCNKLLFSYRDSPLSITNNNNLKDKLRAINLQIKKINELLNSLSQDSTEEEVIFRMIKQSLPKFEITRKTNLIKSMLISKYNINKYLAFIIGYVLNKTKYANI